VCCRSGKGARGLWAKKSVEGWRGGGECFTKTPFKGGKGRSARAWLTTWANKPVFYLMRNVWRISYLRCAYLKIWGSNSSFVCAGFGSFNGRGPFRWKREKSFFVNTCTGVLYFLCSLRGNILWLLCLKKFQGGGGGRNAPLMRGGGLRFCFGEEGDFQFHQGLLRFYKPFVWERKGPDSAGRAGVRAL